MQLVFIIMYTCGVETQYISLVNNRFKKAVFRLFIYWLFICCLFIVCLLFVHCLLNVCSLFVRFFRGLSGHCAFVCCSFVVHLLFIHCSFVVRLLFFPFPPLSFRCSFVSIHESWNFVQCWKTLNLEQISLNIYIMENQEEFNCLSAKCKFC